MSSHIDNVVKSYSIESSSRKQSAATPPQQTTNSGRQLRSSYRLRTNNRSSNDKSLPSSIVKLARLSDTGMEDVTINAHEPTTMTVQDKVAAFMDAIRTAMTTLVQDHGYSRERARISLLDQLISSTQQQQHANTMDTIGSTVRGAAESCTTTSIPSSLSCSITDENIFNLMRAKNIGMEHATIALTIEQAISSMLNDSSLSYVSMAEVLDTWTHHLQYVQPKPLMHLAMKSSSTFGSPLTTLHVSTMSPIASRQQPVPTTSTTASSMQQSSNAPGTPASTMDATGSGKGMMSRTRSKTGVKKTNKAAIGSSTPPLSTITISTTPSTASSQHRLRADSVTDAVSVKRTLSTSAMDGECNPHIPIVSRGKPPLAPNTSGLSSASGVGSNSASIVGRSSSSTASLNTGNSNSKRNTGDSIRLEREPESSLSLNGGGRPASPSSLTLPSSNKRQRRSTSMNSDN